MSVSSQAPGTGQSAAGTGSLASRAGDRDPAGLLPARLSVAPTLIVAAFLIGSFPLPPARKTRPAIDGMEAV